MRRTLHQAGFSPDLARRVAVVVFEAGLNIVIHAYSGEVRVRVWPAWIEVEAVDRGPGIADIQLAMQEGYSTAPPEVREMGYGSGMGLPNMARSADKLTVASEPGLGTRVRAEFSAGTGEGQG
ncbi:MAG: ATP-binding protein [Moorellales bacterium]